jgi:hypothetical protein
MEKKDPKDPSKDCISSVYNSFLFFSDFFVKANYTRVLQEIYLQINNERTSSSNYS